MPFTFAQDIIETIIPPRPVQFVTIHGQSLGIGPYITFDANALHMTCGICTLQSFNECLNIFWQFFAVVDCDVDLSKDEEC